MIETLVLFGATGDLARRFLLPALGALAAAGELPDSFRLIGSAREHLDDRGYRERVAVDLPRFAPDLPPSARDAVVRSVRYLPARIDDAGDVARLLEGGRPAAIYLALPPGLFPAAVATIAAVGLAPGSRIAVEKPFGEDLQSTLSLDRLLAEAAGAEEAEATFRVDHVLGMATVQNLLAMRLANPLLDAIWNSDHVERVEILWEETLALEGRAAYYDRAGAVRDVIQNHVLQLLALVAMELPATGGANAVRRSKVEALRSIRPMTRDAVASRTRRARYAAGQLASDADGGGRSVPAYRDEAGVDPGRGTETFAEIVLELDAPRWHGTPFMLRAGKALSRRRKLVVLRFRGGPKAGADSGDGGDAGGATLSIGIDGPDDVALRLVGGAPTAPAPIRLTAPPPPSDLPPYARVLLDILSGGSALSVSAEEAEAAWRAVTPILAAWGEGLVPIEEYRAGSTP